MTWRDHAACQGQDPEIWHSPMTVELARSYCRRCPVRELCLTHSVADREPFGVWGGYTAAERLRVRLTVNERERLFVLTEVEKGASTIRQLVDRLGIDVVRARRHVHRLELIGLVVVTRDEHHPLRFEVA